MEKNSEKQRKIEKKRETKIKKIEKAVLKKL